jgi:hypothetical protein
MIGLDLVHVTISLDALLAKLTQVFCAIVPFC